MPWLHLLHLRLMLQVETFLNWWVNGQNGVSYTPGGLAYTTGNEPLPNAANAAFLAMAYGKSLEGTSRYSLTCPCIHRSNLAVANMVHASMGISTAVIKMT